eukprot:1771236-Rhodomonas_salina.2
MFLFLTAERHRDSGPRHALNTTKPVVFQHAPPPSALLILSRPDAPPLSLFLGRRHMLRL